MTAKPISINIDPDIGSGIALAAKELNTTLFALTNSSTDTFRFRGGFDGPTLVGVDTYSFGRVDLILRDSSGIIFENDALPSTELLVSDFSSARLDFIFFSDDLGGTWNVGTNLLAVAVPDPSSVVLVSCFGMFSLLRRKRRTSLC